MAGISGQPSAKPGSIPNPVPNEDLASAASAFVTQAGNQMPEAPAGEPDLASAAQQFAGSPEAQAPTNQPGAVMQTLDAAGRVLDYPGGFMRAGLANVAGGLSGQGNIVTEQDLAAAAKGKGPNSAEYLKRLGITEGGSVSLPFVGKVTLRDAEGLALDIGTDPLTAMTKLIKGAPYIGKLFGAPGKASEALGEMVYKSGLAKIDAKLAKSGKGAVSDILLAEGKTGTTAKLAKDVEDMSNSMGKVRQGLYDKATELGAQVDLNKTFTKTEGVIDKIRRDPTPQNIALANELEAMLNSYKNRGSATMDLVSEWKSALYDALPKSAFNGGGRLSGTAKQFKGALAADLKNAIIETGNKAEKGLGDAIDHVNDKWGTLLSAKDPMKKQASAAAGRSLVDWIDWTLGAAGHPGVAVAKKAGQLAGTTYGKTVVGKALIEAGKKGITDALTRRVIVEGTRPGAPPPPAELPQAPPEEAPPVEE